MLHMQDYVEGDDKNLKQECTLYNKSCMTVLTIVYINFGYYGFMTAQLTTEGLRTIVG